MRRPVREEAIGPFFGLVTLWFGMEYLRPQDYAGAIGALRPALILLIAVFLVWLARGDKSALKDNLVRGYALFLAVGVISIFSAANTYWAAQSNLYLFAFLVGGVLPFIAFIDRPQALRRFFGWWVLFHALVAIGGLIRHGKGSGSFMEDENDLALTLAMALPFAYFLATHTKTATWLRALLFVAGTVMLAAIVVTRSRGGFLGMVMAALAIVWFSRNRLRNMAAVTVIGVIAAAVLSQTYLSEASISEAARDPGYRQRHAQSYLSEMQSIQDARDATRRSRLYYWGRAWEMFVDHPLLGVGSGNFGWVVEQYERRDPQFAGNRALSGGRVSHSIYFTLLPEYGVVGTTIFGVLAYGVWGRFKRARARLDRKPGDDAETVTALSRAGSASLLAFLVSGAFLTVLYYPHFWYLLGFAIALDRVAARLAPAEAKVPRFKRVGLAQARA